MKNVKNLKVTAYIDGPIAGSIPYLESLLEYQAGWLADSILRDSNGEIGKELFEWRNQVAGEQNKHTGFAQFITRDVPAPPVGKLLIPIIRDTICDHLIAKSSSPIFSIKHEFIENISKRFDSSEGGRHLGGKKKTINHASGPGKDFFRSVNCILTDKIVWFCRAGGEAKGGKDKTKNGERKYRSAISTMKRKLKEITHLGMHRRCGYGKIIKWEIEEIEKDLSWFANTEKGRVLMRPLPVKAITDDVIGVKKIYGACQPPYWHPDRMMYIGSPF